MGVSLQGFLNDVNPTNVFSHPTKLAKGVATDVNPSNVFSGTSKAPVGEAVNAVSGAVNSVGTATSSISDIVGKLGSGQLWKGIALLIAGVLILLFAAKEILGITAVPVPV